MAKLIINPEYNTSVPNFIYEPSLWHHEGRKGMSAAYVLIYLLLIDKVTEAYEDEDGSKTGVVLGGAPVSFKDIAATLGCSYSTVQRATAHLVRVGLIRRHEASMTDGYRYEVLNCRKEFKTIAEDGSIIIRGRKISRVQAPSCASETTLEEDDDVV